MLFRCAYTKIHIAAVSSHAMNLCKVFKIREALATIQIRPLLQHTQAMMGSPRGPKAGLGSDEGSRLYPPEAGSAATGNSASFDVTQLSSTLLVFLKS